MVLLHNALRTIGQQTEHGTPKPSAINNNINKRNTIQWLNTSAGKVSKIINDILIITILQLK